MYHYVTAPLKRWHLRLSDQNCHLWAKGQPHFPTCFLFRVTTLSSVHRAIKWSPCLILNFIITMWKRKKEVVELILLLLLSLQSCPTLCDPIDGSPPGYPVPGILQARTLEWVAISFSKAWKWKVKVKSLSRVRLSGPIDCSLPGSSAHGIFQARVVEWGAIAFSRNWY